MTPQQVRAFRRACDATKELLKGRINTRHLHGPDFHALLDRQHDLLTTGHTPQAAADILVSEFAHRMEEPKEMTIEEIAAATDRIYSN